MKTKPIKITLNPVKKSSQIHYRMIRFEIAPSGPGMLKLFFHKRHKREGRMYERHPTLEDHVTAIRGG